MSEYRVTIKGFHSGLNEVLGAFTFDRRTNRVYNRVKNANDNLMIRHLRFSDFRNVKMKTPIKIHYHIYAGDKRHDRMNIASAADKSFEDALQKVGMIKNDGWNDIVDVSFDWDIDRIEPRIEVTITEVTI